MRAPAETHSSMRGADFSLWGFRQSARASHLAKISWNQTDLSLSYTADFACICDPAHRCSGQFRVWLGPSGGLSEFPFVMFSGSRRRGT